MATEGFGSAFFRKLLARHSARNGIVRSDWASFLQCPANLHRTYCGRKELRPEKRLQQEELPVRGRRKQYAWCGIIPPIWVPHASLIFACYSGNTFQAPSCFLAKSHSTFGTERGSPSRPLAFLRAIACCKSRHISFSTASCVRIRTDFDQPQGRMLEHKTISPELSSVVQAKNSSYTALSHQ